MRVALIVTGGVDRSGRERVVPIFLSLIEHLARRHEVAVYVLRYLDTPATYPLLGATIYDLGRPEGIVRQYRATLAAIRRDGPFDVIHGHWALTAGLVAALVGRRLGTPAVVMMDSGEFVALPEIGYGAQQTWRQSVGVALASRLARQTLVCSRFQARLAEDFQITPCILPLGVDLERFSPPTAPPLEGPPWRLLHVGSLNRVKDHATLLRAFRQLLDRGVDAHLDLCGEDTLGGSIQALAADLGLGQRATFHGVVPSDRLLGFYHRAHALVVSSRHEAAGVVMLEAAACGVPVVGRAVGYLADWAPACARAARSDTAAALSDAVRGVLADPEERRRLAESALAWARAHDITWTVRSLERLYRSMQ